MLDRIPFANRVRQGQVLDVQREMDNEIDLWHEKKPNCSLHEWLGFSWDEYCYWLEHPRDLSKLLDRKVD